MWTDLVNAVNDSLTNILQGLANFIPNIVAALIIFVVGWLVAIILAWAVDKVLRAVQLPALFKIVKLEDLLQKAEIKHDTVGLIAAMVKWILYLVAFIAAIDALKIPAVSAFLTSILGYVPAVVGAVAIMLLGVILAFFLGNVITASLKAANLGHGKMIGSIARYAVIVFTFIAVLIQLQIATYLFSTLFTGLVAFLVIAGGIAFGLGSKDAAAEIIGKIKKDLSE
jgi:hypothetical protein